MYSPQLFNPKMLSFFSNDTECVSVRGNVFQQLFRLVLTHFRCLLLAVPKNISPSKYLAMFHLSNCFRLKEVQESNISQRIKYNRKVVCSQTMLTN